MNTVPSIARWDGGTGLDAISLHPAAEGPLLAISHFGHGVLTFSVNALFRTEPGYDLMATGPFNEPKDGLQPLTGIIETDWAPSTFTMNWKFTRKLDPVAFEQDEPFCMIFPVSAVVGVVEPEIRALESDPGVSEAYLRWTEAGRGFNKELQQPGSDAQARKWQKDYFRGTPPIAPPRPTTAPSSSWQSSSGCRKPRSAEPDALDLDSRFRVAFAGMTATSGERPIFLGKPLSHTGAYPGTGRPAVNASGWMTVVEPAARGNFSAVSRWMRSVRSGSHSLCPTFRVHDPVDEYVAGFDRAARADDEPEHQGPLVEGEPCRAGCAETVEELAHRHSTSATGSAPLTVPDSLRWPCSTNRPSTGSIEPSTRSTAWGSRSSKMTSRLNWGSITS